MNNNNSPYNFFWGGRFGFGGQGGNQFRWNNQGAGVPDPNAQAPVDQNYVMTEPQEPVVYGPQNQAPATQAPVDTSQFRWGQGGGGGFGSMISKATNFLGSGIGGAAGMATPLGIGLSIAGGVIGAVKARKEQRRARKQAKKAKKELNRQMDAFKQMDTSNPYLNMENTMEDLTINQKQFELEKQQNQQNQANILDSLRGAAGGGGVAALAQQMAQSGQLASQKAAARIGDQERQNQMAERREASRIQGLEIGGEIQKREDEAYKTQTLLGMAQQNYASKKEAQAAAKQQKWDAITGTVTGAADMFAGFGQGDGTTE